MKWVVASPGFSFLFFFSFFFFFLSFFFFFSFVFSEGFLVAIPFTWLCSNVLPIRS